MTKSYEHTQKKKTSHSNNSIIYIRILLRFYHFPVSNALHFITQALVILNYPLVLE